jgi:hypothetical protein
VIKLTAKSGAAVELSAEGSSDPDGNAFQTTWSVYPEAGTFRGEVALSATESKSTRLVVPKVEKPETIHVVLQLEDNGEPGLVAYRRAVITALP